MVHSISFSFLRNLSVAVLVGTVQFSLVEALRRFKSPDKYADLWETPISISAFLRRQSVVVLVTTVRFQLAGMRRHSKCGRLLLQTFPWDYSPCRWCQGAGVLGVQSLSTLLLETTP